MSKPETTLTSKIPAIEALVAEFNGALEEARECALLGETDPPSEAVWTFAFLTLSRLISVPNAQRQAAPTLSYLRQGAVSAEWHALGINLEMRFRDLGAPYVLVEDARDILSRFEGYDGGFQAASRAFRELIVRAQ